MRNFRTAAVAAATAVAVSFAGTSVAFAQSSEETGTSENTNSTSSQNQDQDADTNPDADNEGDDANGLSSIGGGSSKIGDQTEADTPVTGVDLIGNETDDENNPSWGMIWRDGTYASLAAGVVGAIIAAYNFAVYNGILPNHILDGFFGR